jgi:PAS domain S-box-containing protein
MGDVDRAANTSTSASKTSADEPRATRPDIVTTTWAALKRLTDLSPDPLIVTDHQGMITLANPQAGAQFGYRLDQLLNLSVEALLPDSRRARHITYRAGYLDSPHMRPMGVGLDLVGRRQDGSEFPVDISLRPCLIKDQLYVIAAVRDVSVQRQWERERADLLERLRLQGDLINLAHDAILVRDPAGRILVWNTGAEELYGWTAKEAIGQVAHLLFKTRYPISRTAVEAQLNRDSSWEGELAHTRPDGRTVIVESRQALVRDASGQPSAVLEINRDITERRRLEEAEAMTQASTLARLTFLQQLVDALPNGVYVVHGQDARLVLANRAAASAFRAIWQPEQPMREFLEAHGLLLTDAQGRPLAPDSWATLRALWHGETTLQLQETIQRPEGDGLPVLVNAVPLAFSYWRSLDPLGDDAGAHGVSASPATDPADGAHDEPLALVIQQDVHVLKEMEYIKDEFIGLAAHELRTPVAALKGAVETLLLQTRQGRGAELADWQREMLQEIDLATDRLTNLTDDLLDVTRLQAGQLQLHPMPTDLVALTRRVTERIQRTAPQRRLDFAPPASESDAPSDPVIATVDSARIEQVLDNLITNAIKYSPGGGAVQITLTRRGGGAGEPDGASVELSVRDEGMGIPARQQSLIFGRFMRADNARHAGIHGTGLGLYISRGVIEQLGGRLWFESEEGKGATFFVSLPLTPE